MLIKEACEKCGLTKKALEYYEAKGLVCPRISENGYRDYSDEDILRLKEISVLRKCGVDVAEIKFILSSASKSAALKKLRYISEIREKRLDMLRENLSSLIACYDIEKAFAKIQDNEQILFALLTVKERLAIAFPGDYGLFVSAHFGSFLGGTVDTPEKKAAYDAIISYLDSVEMTISPELSALLESLYPPEIDIESITEKSHAEMSRALDNPAEYLEENEDDIKEYLDYRTSDDFAASPAGELMRALLEFQQQSGYRKHLVCNMMILSREYADYMKKLRSADDAFAEKFPQSSRLYR